MNNTWVNSRWLHTTLANNNPSRQCAFAVRVIINSSGGKGMFHVVLNFFGDFEFLNPNIQARDVWRAYSRCGSRGSSPVCGVFRLWTSEEIFVNNSTPLGWLVQGYPCPLDSEHLTWTLQVRAPPWTCRDLTLSPGVVPSHVTVWQIHQARAPGKSCYMLRGVFFLSYK